MAVYKTSCVVRPAQAFCSASLPVLPSHSSGSYFSLLPKMTFGILEPVGLSVLPAGTVCLEEANTLVLSPRPSSSPDDPLNWSRWRKELLFFTILLGSSICGVIGPLLVPAFEIIAQDLGVLLSQVLLLNGALILALGFSTCICSSLAQVYGSRLVFLATTALLIGSCCWAASSSSYGSLLAARVFQGMIDGFLPKKNRKEKTC